MSNTEPEIRVLEALSQPRRLTFSQLQRVTSLGGEELRLALGGLRVKGLVVRLETVIESYSYPIGDFAAARTPVSAGGVTASPRRGM